MTDVAVGQMRRIEFIADEEGDWSFHCYKSHHRMSPALTSTGIE